MKTFFMFGPSPIRQILVAPLEQLVHACTQHPCSLFYYFIIPTRTCPADSRDENCNNDNIICMSLCHAGMNFTPNTPSTGPRRCRIWSHGARKCG